MRPPLIAALLLLAGCRGGAPGPSVLHGIVEIQSVHVASRVAGRVVETPAAEGSLLEAGDPVAVLEAPELEARRAGAAARVAAETAALERARNGPRREEIDASRAALDSVRARLALLRAGSRPEEVRAAAADLAAAEAELARAVEDASRRRELFDAGAVTRDELDASLAARDRLEARRNASRARADLVGAGSRKEEIDEAAADVARREADLALLVAGTRPEEVAAAEARLEEARAGLAALDADLAERVVRSPGRAILEVLSVRPGDVLAANAPVARLLRAGDLWVKVFVPETSIGAVTLGGGAAVTVDSFPGRTFRGKVASIGSQAEYTPRNVQSADERRHQVFAVKVVVEDPEGVFKSGMAADVELDGAAPR